MAKKKTTLPDLSPAQQEVMDVIRQLKEASAAQVRQQLQSEGRDLARNTVRTLLERMEEKGWVKHRVEGRAYIYAAAHDEQTTTGSKVVQLLENVCGGSPEALMTALLDYRGLSSSELRRVRKLLDDAQKKTDSGKRSK